MSKIQYQTDAVLVLHPAPNGAPSASFHTAAVIKWTKGADDITIHQANDKVRLTRHQLLDLARELPAITKDLLQDSDNETDACSSH